MYKQIGSFNLLDTIPLLTLIRDPGTFTPVGAQGGGGSTEPYKKTTSHRNFAMKFASYMYALSKIIIPEKN